MIQNSLIVCNSGRRLIFLGNQVHFSRRIMKNQIILFLLFFTLILGCKKTIYIDSPPQLEIAVVDASNNKVLGAEVTIFLSEDDWQNKTNPVAQITSDVNGSALFTDLEETIYYFYVQKGSLDNTLATSYFQNPLKMNEIRVVQTTIN
jgi:hypothetical protein